MNSGKVADGKKNEEKRLKISLLMVRWAVSTPQLNPKMI